MTLAMLLDIAEWLKELERLSRMARKQDEGLKDLKCRMM